MASLGPVNGPSSISTLAEEEALNGWHIEVLGGSRNGEGDTEFTGFYERLGRTLAPTLNGTVIMKEGIMQSRILRILDQ